MAAFYLDENVAVAIAPALRALGHMATTAEEERRLGASDSIQLLHAADRSWTLITHNRRDYRLLHDAWLLWTNAWNVDRHHTGIIIIEQRPAQPASEIAALIHEFVRDLQTPIGNTLYDWRLAFGWARFPAFQG